MKWKAMEISSSESARIKVVCLRICDCFLKLSHEFLMKVVL